MHVRSPSLQMLSQAAAKAAAHRNRPVRTWVHELFQVGAVQVECMARSALHSQACRALLPVAAAVEHCP